MKTVVINSNTKKIISKKAVIIILLCYVIVLAIVKENFLTVDNLLNILLKFSAYSVVGYAMTIAIIGGEFDLSPSSVFGFSTILFISMTNKVGVPLAIFITLASGAIIGAINGILVSKAKINAFVVTLGTLTFVKGLALFYTNGNPVSTTNEFVKGFGQANLFGISYLIIISFIVLLLSAAILKYTRFGRNIYATGGNSDVASLVGINVKFYKFIVFVIVGFASAFAGLMVSCRILTGSSVYGQDIALSAIAAVVIGGTSLSGGSGGVFRTFIGLILMAVLSNSLTIFGLQGYYDSLIKGIVLMVVVIFDTYTNRFGAKK